MDDVRGRQWSVGGGRTFTELPDWIRRLLRLRQPPGLRDFGHGMVGNRERTTALAVVRPDSGSRLTLVPFPLAEIWADSAGNDVQRIQRNVTSEGGEGRVNETADPDSP